MVLEKKDQRLIEQYFDMATGYVLHYSNRTFEELFEQFNIEIYEDRYSEYGGSKAKRLRAFFEKHDHALIGKVLLEMIDEYDIERDANPLSYAQHNDALRQKCVDIGIKLKGSSTTPNQSFTNQFKQQQSQTKVQHQQPVFPPTQPTTPPIMPKEKVFIVHGHNEELLIKTENLCHKLNLEPIILKDQHSGGRTIIEKLEVHSHVKYAVILYTACDEGRKINDGNLKKRARQNVVFEHGYFIGKLGRGKVAAIIKGDVEIQGDIGGVVYVPYIGGWEFNLAKEMQGSGLTVDLNNI